MAEQITLIRDDPSISELQIADSQVPAARHLGAISLMPSNGASLDAIPFANSANISGVLHPEAVGLHDLEIIEDLGEAAIDTDLTLSPVVDTVEGINRSVVQESVTREARNKLMPPKGLEIKIERDEVAVETARQLDVFRQVVSGQLEDQTAKLHEGQAISDPVKIFEQLSDLATLYISEDDFATLKATLLTSGMSAEQAETQVTVSKETHLLKVATILEQSIRGTDNFLHDGHIPDIVLSGAAKPRGRLMKGGEYKAGSGTFVNRTPTPAEIITQMRADNSREGYGTSTHSLLLHTRQRESTDDMHLNSLVLMPASAVLDKLPVVISGQDGRSTRLGETKSNLFYTRIRGADEAHSQDRTRYEYGRVEIEADETFLAALPKVDPRRMREDVTFMPESTTLNAENSYDYEIGIGEAVVLLDAYGESHVIETLLSKLPEDSPIRKVRGVFEQLDAHINYGVATKIIKFKREDDEGKPADYPTPESEYTWGGLIAEYRTALAEYEDLLPTLEGYVREAVEENSANTAIIRFLMKNTGYTDEQAAATYDSAAFRNLGYGSEAERVFLKMIDGVMKAKSGATDRTRYVEFKQFQLSFSQTDMAKSATEAYARNHETATVS